MSQGDKFQLAVAYPLMNPNFSLPNKGRQDVTTVYTGGFTLNTGGVSPDTGGLTLSFLNLLYKKGDRIHIGPSTRTGFINESESFLVNTLNLTDFTGLTGVLTNHYESGDPYWGYGSALAAGWYITGAGLNNNSESGIVVGNFDNFAQRLKIIGSSLGDFLILRQDLDKKFLIDAIRYRAGFVYTFGNQSTETAIFQIDVDGSILQVDTPLTNFRSKTHLVIKNWNSSPKLSFKIRDPGTGSITIAVDEVYLEHTFDDFTDVKGSNSNISRRTEIPVTNAGFGNGYYEFDEFPDLNSVRINKNDVFSELMFASGSKAWRNSKGLGEKTEKYSFGCKFSDVSQLFYDVLLEFDRLQKNGHTFNIHTNIDDLPSVMRGSFKINGLEKNSWDLSLRSFNFEFVEA